MSKIGEDFERAVHAFVNKLDPNAEVLFDHLVPDSYTGDLRQCDVWVNAKFGGVYPVKIYISCKNHKRKLDIGDIDTFDGEIKARRPDTGVIYSKSGFTESAIRKGKAMGISCCRLYENEPADIPEMIFFNNYACYPSLSIELLEDGTPKEWKYWDDVFYQKVDNLEIIKIIEKGYFDGEQLSVDTAKKDGKPPLDWENTISIRDDKDKFFLKIRVLGWWRFYKGRAEATYYNGSYNYFDNQFHGSFTGPVIDTQGSEPGHDWEKINRQEFDQSASRFITIMHSGKVKDQIIQVFGKNLLNEKIPKVYND